MKPFARFSFSEKDIEDLETTEWFEGTTDGQISMPLVSEPSNEVRTFHFFLKRESQGQAKIEQCEDKHGRGIQRQAKPKTRS